MRTIGVRELKAHLSRALREVQGGERYLVTDRGRVVAELRQPGDDADKTLSPADQAVLRMAAAGELRVAERPRTSHEKTAARLPDGTGQAWLDWVRGEQ